MDGPDPIEVDVALKSAGSIKVHVLLPEDKRHHIVTQRWDKEKRIWLGDISGMGSSGRERADPNGELWIQPLRAGRYRVVDARSKIMSDPLDVVGGQEAAVTLDLSKTGWVQGRVIPPPGVPVKEFTVGVEGEPRTSARWVGYGTGLPGRPVDPRDGVFLYRVPGNKPVTIRVFHMTCKPHPTKGSVTVESPREGVELHAVEGPRAIVKLAEPLRMYVNPGRARPVTVRLYKGNVKGKGTQLVGMLNSSQDTIEFGGFEAGKYTVWIDLITAPPLVLYNAKLPEENSVDLGTHSFDAGSSLRIRFLVKEGQSPPRMHVSATKVGDPAYWRNAGGAGETVVLRGLGKGTFQIFAGSYGGAAGARIKEKITFDGKNDVERTIDLR